MERRGSGFKKIIEDYSVFDEFTHRLRPEFKSDANSFFITLWNLNYYMGNVVEHVTDQKTDQKKQIIELIAANNFISRAEIARELGVHDSSVKRRLNSLIADGLIRRVGPAKGGHWEIITPENIN